MSLERISVPALEPVSLQDMKKHLRLDHDVEDDVLAAFITAARIFLETKLSLSFLSARWSYRPRHYERDGCFKEHRYRDVRARCIQMPLFPVKEVHQVKLYLSDGSVVLSDLRKVSLKSFKRPAVLEHQGLPLSVQAEYGAEIEFTAGYGDAPEDVPQPLRLAIKMLAAYFYENRIDQANCSAASLPSSVSMLLMDFMEVRLK